MGTWPSANEIRSLVPSESPEATLSRLIPSLFQCVCVGGGVCRAERGSGVRPVDHVAEQELSFGRNVEESFLSL